MTGNPLLLELLARTIQEEHLAAARRERSLATARRNEAGRIAALLASLRRTLTSAGRRIAHLRTATFTR